VRQGCRTLPEGQEVPYGLSLGATQSKLRNAGNKRHQGSLSFLWRKIAPAFFAKEKKLAFGSDIPIEINRLVSDTLTHPPYLLSQG
jgi:hypothetical protein